MSDVTITITVPYRIQVHDGDGQVADYKEWFSSLDEMRTFVDSRHPSEFCDVFVTGSYAFLVARGRTAPPVDVLVATRIGGLWQ